MQKIISENFYKKESSTEDTSRRHFDRNYALYLYLMGCSILVAAFVDKLITFYSTRHSSLVHFQSSKQERRGSAVPSADSSRTFLCLSFSNQLNKLPPHILLQCPTYATSIDPNFPFQPFFPKFSTIMYQQSPPYSPSFVY